MKRPPDLRHKDPEVRKERVKLIANGLTAIGLAMFIGAVVAPYIDSTRQVRPGGLILGGLGGLALVAFAYYLLRYIKSKEP